ncbi:HNH endonuclease [Rhodobacteraceae bacterium B1Z28]|uniref:HNH endonuclease n=1 Tax=Ruegeria haliotis TaxID=2747601 RepID=A0ABX2PLQ8_9RHOB|nr:HNH endonuclease [Ruegeria haliotis]NVO54646.1 HNH endonuclease [Ruegeria haliotis]
MSDFDDLKPKDRENIDFLLEKSGFDMAGWVQKKVDEQLRIGVSPRQPKWAPRSDGSHWAWKQGDKIVLSVWHDPLHLIERDGKVVATSADRARDIREGKNQKALEFAEIIAAAVEEKLYIQTIVLLPKKTGNPGKKMESSGKREFDSAPWTVTAFNGETGEYEVTRGKHPFPDPMPIDPELRAFEGEKRGRFVSGRYRERRLREQKVKKFKQDHGRLFCEVPDCGFDFELAYGEIGRDFAEVHHLNQLSKAPENGTGTALDQFAVVCANCHRMIHRGGECRALKEVSPKGARNVQ